MARRMGWTIDQKIRFAIRLVEFRERYGLARKDLAVAMKSNARTIQMVESGRTQPSDEFVVKFGEVEETWKKNEERSRKAPIAGWTI